VADAAAVRPADGRAVVGPARCYGNRQAESTGPEADIDPLACVGAGKQEGAHGSVVVRESRQGKSRSVRTDFTGFYVESQQQIINYVRSTMVMWQLGGWRRGSTVPVRPRRRADGCRGGDEFVARSAAVV
jgi:hypothetical protein